MVSNDNIEAKLAHLKAGKLTCIQNAKTFLAEIEKKNKKLNIILETNPNLLDDAKKLDKKREKGDKLGTLFGLCFVFKSNISIKDMIIRCASKTLDNYKGTFNADVVERILEEDGLILGVVNNDEFASGISGETSAFKPTDNPSASGRVPGGSSSGSAAAIAADFCDIALGSDTGGSIRNPASHCAIVGIKPSYGRVSRYGLVDLSMSLDQIGPFSRDIYGSALALSVIAGASKNDPTTIDNEVQNYTKIEQKKKYKIGVISGFKEMIKSPEIKRIYEEKIDKIKAAGHDIIELKIDAIELAVQAYYPIVFTEFFSGTRKFDGIKYGKKIEDSAGEEVLRRIFGGAVISESEFDGAYYKKALKVKDIIAQEFDKSFKKVDFILTPVTPNLPHKIGANVSAEDAYAEDAFTTPANLAGICGGVISRDFATENGEKIPVGIQVFAGKFKEKILFEGINLLENLN